MISWILRTSRSKNSLKKTPPLSGKKNFTEKKCDRIFHYYATGWNRDGLALSEAAELLQLLPSPADKHLLLILTDAAPNDSQRILPSENAPFGAAYEEHAAIKKK